MDKVTTWLWCDGTAEEQVDFYTGLVPGSRVTQVMRAAVDYPGGPAGKVLTVEFELAGRGYALLDGGPGHPHTQAASLLVLCDDQAEVDRVWGAIAANGGTPVQCGWITDRWGLSWQVTPRALMDAMADPDPAAAGRVMRVMMTMVKIDVVAIEAARRGDADGPALLR